MKFSHMLVKGLFALLITAVPVSFINQSPVSAGANTCTWTGAGADANWSTAGNWSCTVGTVPATGYDLVFPYMAVDQTPINDMSAANVYTGIWYSGTAPTVCGTYALAYDITGNDLQLSGDILSQIVNGCSKPFRINNNITLSSNTTIDLSTASNQANLYFNGQINMGAFDLTINSNLAELTNQRVGIGGDIIGSGNIIANGILSLSGDNSAFTGDITIEDGSLQFGESSLGDSSGQTYVNNNANLVATRCASDMTITENITFNGSMFVNAAAYYPELNAKLSTTAGCGGGGAGGVFYESFFTPYDITFSGVLTLNTDILVGPFHNVILSGTLDGVGRTVTIVYDSDPMTAFYGSNLDVSAISNNTNTANGLYVNPTRTTTLSDTDISQDLFISKLNDVTITGTRAFVAVTNGGILRGDGTIGDLYAGNASVPSMNEAYIKPGLSPGILTTGDITFYSGAEIEIELEGTTPGATSGYDQFDVTGTVSLGDSTLDLVLYNGYTPNLNDTYMIISNDEADAVTGTFGGLAEGSTVTVSGFEFTISYTGGDGNDVVLTSSLIPGPPGTGFGLVTQSTAAPMIIAATGLTAVLMGGLKVRSTRR